MICKCCGQDVPYQAKCPCCGADMALTSAAQTADQNHFSPYEAPKTEVKRQKEKKRKPATKPADVFVNIFCVLGLLLVLPSMILWMSNIAILNLICMFCSLMMAIAFIMLMVRKSGGCKAAAIVLMLPSLATLLHYGIQLLQNGFGVISLIWIPVVLAILNIWGFVNMFSFLKNSWRRTESALLPILPSVLYIGYALFCGGTFAGVAGNFAFYLATIFLCIACQIHEKKR